MLQEIELPCIVDHRPLSVRGSVGIASCPEHARSADALLQRADVAMYQAKSDRVGIAIYTPKRERPHQRRRTGANQRPGLDPTLKYRVENQDMWIAQTAREAGVNAQTLRYYERRGCCRGRPAAGPGYREYSR